MPLYCHAPSTHCRFYARDPEHIESLILSYQYQAISEGQDFHDPSLSSWVSDPPPAAAAIPQVEHGSLLFVTDMLFLRNYGLLGRMHRRHQDTLMGYQPAGGPRFDHIGYSLFKPADAALEHLFPYVPGLAALLRRIVGDRFYEELNVTPDFTVYLNLESINNFAMLQQELPSLRRGGLYKISLGTALGGLTFVPEDVMACIAGYDIRPLLRKAQPYLAALRNLRS